MKYANKFQWLTGLNLRHRKIVLEEKCDAIAGHLSLSVGCMIVQCGSNETSYTNLTEFCQNQFLRYLTALFQLKRLHSAE
jgi:hypothetical protein